MDALVRVSSAANLPSRVAACRGAPPETRNLVSDSCNVALEAAAVARQALTVHKKAGRDPSALADNGVKGTQGGPE